MLDPMAAFNSKALFIFIYLKKCTKILVLPNMPYHACVCVSLRCRDAIESVGSLYNQVDELVHKLVMLSNKCTQELEFIMEFKGLEEGFREVRASLYASDPRSSGLECCVILKR